MTSRAQILSSILRILLVVGCAAILTESAPRCFSAQNDDAEARALKVIERYLQLLKRRPREGTAFDRVYTYYADRGSLESFTSQLEAELARTPDDAATWTVLGMCYQRSGQPELARNAFGRAENLRPNDAIPSWYLGRTLRELGDVDRAAAALERALQRKPVRADQLEIFQLLGNIYQKARRHEEALAVWSRFEAAFPDNERVQEQIAESLANAGRHEEALERYRELAASSNDAGWKIKFGIRVAELLSQIERPDEATETYENLLTELRPDSWLFQDVRRRLEESFLQADNDAGLVDYYERWLRNHPDDTDAMSRIARYLIWQQRGDEAISWYRRAIEQAPSDVALRRALIDQLVADENYPDALGEYRLLADLTANDPDIIESWGRLHLRHGEGPDEQRREEAAGIWQKLIEANANDARTVVRVAGLLQTAGLDDEALALYQQAVELEPNDLQYHESLGEFLYAQEQVRQAHQAWEAMVAGDRRTRENLLRLAEVYERFNDLRNALVWMEQACQTSPEFGDLIRFSRMLRDAGETDRSLEQLRRAESQSDSPEELEVVLTERIMSLQVAGKLSAETRELARAVEQDGTARQWRTLALYFEAQGKLTRAAEAAHRALEIDPESVLALKTVAEISEQAGLFAEASAARRRLVETDRRYQSEHLKKVAELERRLGRSDAAIAAAEELIEATPDQLDHYRFCADLCFSLGQTESGIEFLRRAVQISPSDAQALASLAEVLAREYRTEEAIDLYWRAFDQSTSQNDRISTVQMLTDLYLRTGNFDQLVLQLERRTHERTTRRDMLVCLARAYRVAGDIGLARDTLKRLADTLERDVSLVEELVSLCEEAGDWEDAAHWQERLNRLQPTSEGAFRLANLLLQAGNPEAAAAVWQNSAATDSSASGLFESIDRLMDQHHLEIARSLAERIVESDPKNWEALVRLILIEAEEGHDAAARQRCNQLLSLDIPPDTQSSMGASKNRNTLTNTNAGENIPTPVRRQRLISALMSSFQTVSSRHQISGQIQVQGSTELKGTIQPFSVRRRFNWNSVNDFRDARCVAVGIRINLAAEMRTVDREVTDFRRKAITSPTGNHAAWDWYYACVATAAVGKSVPKAEAVRLLIQEPTAEAHFVYVERALTGAPDAFNDIDQILISWQAVADVHPLWLRHAGGPRALASKLTAAQRESELQRVYEWLTEENTDAGKIRLALEFTEFQTDVSRLMQLTERLVELEDTNLTSNRNQYSTTTLGSVYALAVSRLIREGDQAAAEKLINHFFDIKSLKHDPTDASASKPSGTLSSSKSYAVYHTDGRIVSRRFKTLTPEPYWSASDMTFLVNLANLYSNRMNDLLGILSNYRTGASGRNALLCELATAQLHYLTGAETDAAVHLVRAAELAPEDPSLRINLARLYQKSGNNAEALALLDTIHSMDQTVVKDREQIALELAGKLGQTERVRLAATRLFGMRLSTREAMTLGSKLKGLGMIDLSLALLARTRRTDTNDTADLAVLMDGYRRSGNTDLASQIAYQLLQRTAATSPRQPNGRLQSARRAAIAVLADSGQLDDLIHRTRRQVERTPGSVRLLQSLYDYYQAAGETDQAIEVARQIRSITAVTPERQLATAVSLLNQRNYHDACNVFAALIETEPRIFTQHYFRFIDAFQRANRMPELTAAVLQMDIPNLRNNFQIVSQIMVTLLQNNPGDGAAIDQTFQLFEVAWKEFPAYRTDLMSIVAKSEIWRRKEMFEYAETGLIPQTPQEAIARPWLGIERIVSRSRDGQPQGVISFIRKYGSQDQLAKLEAAIHQFVSSHEHWHGGQILAAILRAHAGDHDAALQILQELPALGQSDEYVPLPTAWILIHELRDADRRYVPLLADLFEQTVMLDSTVAQASDRYQTSPARQLADLQARCGRRDEARQTILNVMKMMDDGHSSGEQITRPKLENYADMADHLTALNYPFLAARCQIAVAGVDIHTALYLSRNTQSTQVLDTIRRANAGLRKSEDQVTADSLVSWLKTELASLNRNADGSVTPIDLMLTPPTGRKSADLGSFVVRCVQKLSLSDDRVRSRLIQDLQELLRTLPDGECSTAVVASILAERMGSESLQNQALEHLQDYISHAAESPSVSEITLWIPARAAMKSAVWRDVAQQLADRAEAAARATTDDAWLLTILRARSEMALASGEQKAAEYAYSRLLDAILLDTVPAQEKSPDLKGLLPTLPGQPKPQPSRPASAVEELRRRLLVPEPKMSLP